MNRYAGASKFGIFRVTSISTLPRYYYDRLVGKWYRVLYSYTSLSKS